MSNRKSGCIHDHSSLSNVFATQASKSFKCCCSWKESHQKLSFSSLSKLSTVKDRVNNYTQNLPHPHTAAPCLLTSIFNSQPNGVSRKYFRTRGSREREEKSRNVSLPSSPAPSCRPQKHFVRQNRGTQQASFPPSLKVATRMQNVDTDRYQR